MSKEASRSVGEWLSRSRTIVAIWLAYAVLSINQSFVWAVVADRERPWYYPVTWTIATAIVWTALTPWIMRLVRARRLGRGTWRRNVWWHAGAVLVAGLVDAGGDQVARVITDMPLAFWADYFRKLDIVTFIYVVIAGATHAADYHDMYERGELRSAQLESQLATSQLESLKSQLQPHFLFNTLNAVNALIHEDPHAADRVLNRLAEMLRMTLNAGSAPEVTLAQEIEFVRAYLEIQRARLGDRLGVTYAVPEELLHARVPALLLQPLVENAVIHGLGTLPHGGTVHIAATRKNGQVTLRVEDDGIGVPATTRIGIGLSNVTTRLQYLYGDKQSLNLAPRAGGGTIVEVSLPFEPADASAL